MILNSGMASFDYEADGYDDANLIKMTVSINGKEVRERKRDEFLPLRFPSSLKLFDLPLQQKKRNEW